MRSKRPLVAVIAVGAILLSSCTPSGPPEQRLAEPDPARPVVELSYDVADDLQSATGREQVTFTPDERVCEMIFRAWPNKPGTASTGNSLTVREVQLDGRGTPFQVEQAGAPAGTPGTLIRVPLPACHEAGNKVQMSLDFDIKMAPETDERIGRDAESDIAWFGSAFPMLAWKRGEGWATDPAVRVTGESAVSEVFDLRKLEVAAPSRYQVTGVGPRDEAHPGTDGKTVHTFAESTVRDVTVSVGAFEITSAQLGSTNVHLALPSTGSRGSRSEWDAQVQNSLSLLEERFGKVPYTDLWLSVLPGVSEGVEYPGAVQFGDLNPRRDSWLITHELAHQWFYALVGSDQARNPWMDESLTTYAQESVAPAGISEGGRRAEEGELGQPMSYFAEQRRANDTYTDTVYTYGGRVLLQIRDRNPEQFDAAIRNYINEQAYQIATPEDFEKAMRDVPGAVDALRQAGAF